MKLFLSTSLNVVEIREGPSTFEYLGKEFNIFIISALNRVLDTLLKWEGLYPWNVWVKLKLSNTKRSLFSYRLSYYGIVWRLLTSCGKVWINAHFGGLCLYPTTQKNWAGQGYPFGWCVDNPTIHCHVQWNYVAAKEFLQSYSLKGCLPLRMSTHHESFPEFSMMCCIRQICMHLIQVVGAN